VLQEYRTSAPLLRISWAFWRRACRQVSSAGWPQ
jgi:hypothetical protein